jgi:hypothetical protein
VFAESYFCNTGAGIGEMEKLQDGCATGAEELTQQLSAQSVVEGSKKATDASVLDVSQLWISFI